MKHLINFNNYLLTEAFGLAEPTLPLSDLLIEDTEVVFTDFINSGTNKLNLPEVYDLSASKILKDINWSKFPVIKLKVEYNFIRIPSEEFRKKYPESSKHKNYVCNGFCESIDNKNLLPPIDFRSKNTISLSLGIGGIINEDFNETEDFLVESESTILHELNHAYEAYNRMIRGKGQFSVDLTWGLEVNRSKIRKEIFKEWSDKIGYYLYWSEQHEINAMVQEAWPYVKRYDVDEMKSKCPTWRAVQQMIEFNPVEFKEKMYKLINSYYPDANPEIILNRLKNGLANWLDIERENSSRRLEDAPSLSGEQIRTMNIDKFLSFAAKRINESGEKIQRNILRMYSKKLK